MEFPKWSAIRSFSEIILQKWNPLVVSVNDIFYLIKRENDWGQCFLQFREFMLSVELLIVIFYLFTGYILMWKIDGCHLGKLTNTMILITYCIVPIVHRHKISFAISYANIFKKSNNFLTYTRNITISH